MTNLHHLVADIVMIEEEGEEDGEEVDARYSIICYRHHHRRQCFVPFMAHIVMANFIMANIVITDILMFEEEE